MQSICNQNDDNDEETIEEDDCVSSFFVSAASIDRAEREFMGRRHNRVIIHGDCNCFYASVEIMLNPSLRGKPVAVCGSTEDRHGIVLAKTYEAKARGVQTGMVNHKARECCPGLICVPPQYDQYIKYSKLVRAIYERYTDKVEPYGMDECWCDLSGIAGKSGGVDIAEEIRAAVKSELGLSVSIGVSFNKIFAKLGSDMKKPDAITVLDDAHWKERVWPLKVEELLYCGAKTKEKLNLRGVYTVGDMAKADPEYVKSWLGKNGLFLWRAANGEDESRVMPKDFVSPVKSVGHGVTASRDLTTEEEAWLLMLELCQEVGRKLRIHSLSATGVHLWVKDSKLRTEGWQMKLPYPSQSPMEVAQGARLLFAKHYHWNENVRAITVTAINLVPANQPVQLDLFNDSEKRERKAKLEDCIYELRARFGPSCITNGCLATELPMVRDGTDKVKMPGVMYQ